MFVYPQRRSLTTIAGAVVTLGTLALGACDEPAARTDLRPEGDPEVLAVLVLSDAIGGLYETATYCAVGDEKRPYLVGLPDFTTQVVCDEDLSVPATPAEAAPGGWYVRIMFDELLDPNVEELIPLEDEDGQPTGQFIGTLENTQPVTLRCMGVDGAMHDVAYDGYYSPSGNNVTWPLGPSLVIKPLDPTIVPVASDCQITIKTDVVKDKSGNSVPSDQIGPFTFKTQAVEVIDVFPSGGSNANPDSMNNNCVEVAFNVAIDPTTFDTADVSMDPNPELAVFPDGSFAYLCPGWQDTGTFSPTNGFLDDTEYGITFTPGAMVTDHCGRETELVVPESFAETSFATLPMRLVSITPAQGTGIAPSRKIRIDFNQLINPASLEATEFTVTPAIAGMTLTTAGGDGSTIIVQGRYDIGTAYTFSVNAGATVRDRFDTKDLAIDAQSVTFTTADVIALTAQSPANDTEIEGGTPTDVVAIRLTFNTEMDPTTVLPDEFSITDASGTPVVGVVVLPNAAPSTGVTFVATGLPVGSYTFTLNAGATVNDLIGNTYTQAAARVITFSVVEPAPEPPVEDFLCLGQTAVPAN